MQNKYVKSKKSDFDIKNIAKSSFIDFGANQTYKYMKGLNDALQSLADNPEYGKVYSNLAKDYLYFRHVSQVIYYRKRETDILIIRILHKRMLPEKHL